MSITSFSELIALSQTGNGHSAFIPEDWLQGRTTFGGLTAALCLKAAMDSFSDLPPLRSAQISFIGPAAGEVEITANILRRGRNVTFVQADLIAGKGLATSCIFCFGTTRDSEQNRNKLPMPKMPMPEDVSSLFPPGRGPQFAQHHIEQRLAQGSIPFSGEGEAENHIWVRLRDKNADSDVVSLIAAGDALPPAEMSAFKIFAPISTMTWLINFLTDAPRTRDGWWLLHANAEHSVGGYSSQDMTGWNINGEAVFTARQSIAIFA